MKHSSDRIAISYGHKAVIWIALGVVVYFVCGNAQALAQIRGVYPLGMSASNSGVTPASGFSYANQFLTYSRSQSKDADGVVVATGSNSVVMDMNSIVWVSPKESLAGAKVSLSATLPIAGNSLDSDAVGKISGGSGFADSYYQPFILGWDKKSSAIRAAYGFLAPTGRFEVGTNDNVGSGYWTHVVSSGQTFYLTSDKATSVSAFQMYEFHTAQESTDIHPGQNFDLDYSLAHTIPLRSGLSLQVGLAGYGQWQTTDKSGPSITEEQAKAHYKVNALGFTSNVFLAPQKLSLGFKYFKEFSNRSTFQGHSIQISGAIKF